MAGLEPFDKQPNKTQSINSHFEGERGERERERERVCVKKIDR